MNTSIARDFNAGDANARFSNSEAQENLAGASGTASGVKNVIQNEPIATTEHDQFARNLGFESYLALFEASTPLKARTDRDWIVTALKSDHWIVWTAADLEILGTYPSEEEVRRAVEAQ